MKTSTFLAALACAASAVRAAPLDDPHEPDTAADCFQWIQAIAGDDCNTLAQADNVDINNFRLWNPTLAKDCSAAKVGFYYCTGSHKTSTSPPSTTTPVTPPAPTLDVGMFPPSGGVKQCVTTGKQVPNPAPITSSRTLLTAIGTACTNILKDHMWLEKGLPYTSVVKVGDHDTKFTLQIKLGGFDVPNDMCVTQLKLVLNECTKDGKTTFGGCSYTSDFNLLSCILP